MQAVADPVLGEGAPAPRFPREGVARHLSPGGGGGEEGSAGEA